MGEFLESEGDGALDAAVQADNAGIGLALDRARRRKASGGDAAADRFLAAQEALIADQRHHLDEQLKHMGVRVWSERLKLALQVMTIALGVLVVAGVGRMAWSAAHDDSLVIDSFGAPADLAQQGIGGPALAGDLKDRIARLEDETATAEQGVEVRDQRSGDIKVEIPETGISLGEVRQALNDWLGHETRVSGDLFRVASGPDKGGLALNIRASGQPGVRLVQPDGDLDALLQKGAEQVYRTIQPGRFATWLDQHGRSPEAVALYRNLVARSSGPVRAQALSALANAEGHELTMEARGELFREAVRAAAGGRAAPLNNLAIVELNLGHWRAAYQLWGEASRRRLTDRTSDISERARRQSALISAANLASVSGDSGARLAEVCFEYDVSPCTPQRFVDAVYGARSGLNAGLKFDPAQQTRVAVVTTNFARLHETAQNRRLFALPRVTDPLRSDAYHAEVEAYWVRGQVAQAQILEDWPGVLAAAAAWDGLAARWPGLRSAGATLPTVKPEALAHLGQGAEARRLVEAMPLDCYPCAGTRARVAATLGDAAGADRWFAAMLRLAPELPWAEAEWADVLLKRGDVAGAIAKAEAAHKKQPAYAEPLAAWGEALLARGDAKGAAGKLDEALKVTPHWGRLHLKRAEALARLGRQGDARAELKAAVALDLTASERAELAAQRT